MGELVLDGATIHNYQSHVECRMYITNSATADRFAAGFVRLAQGISAEGMAPVVRRANDAHRIDRKDASAIFPLPGRYQKFAAPVLSTLHFALCIY